MKRIWFPFLLTILLFSNCDSSSEDPVDDNPVQTTDDDITGQDETPPEISISEIPEVIEVTTELTVNISDKSDQVTTVVNLDGTEVFRSTQKSFVFDLNPFDYNLGDKTLEIKATDGSGNEVSKTEGFELKKLFFRYPATTWNHNTATLDTYITVNKSNGELVIFRKIENLNETVEFFADDDFEDENGEIIVSQYLFSNGTDGFNLNFIFSYPEISLGTVFPTDEERESLFQTQFIPPVANQSKSIFIEGSLISKMRGYGGSIFKFGPSDQFEYKFNYSDTMQDGHFIYDFPNGGDEMVDYSYLIINDVSQTNFDVSNFIQPTELFEIAIPTGVHYDLKINGYQDENAYEEFKFHEIFNQMEGDSNGSSFDDIVYIPLIEEYSFYQKDLTLQMDSKTWLSMVQKGLRHFEVSDLNVQIDGDQITIQGDYDIYNFSMNNGDTWVMGPPSSPFFSWSFFGKHGDGVTIPFSSFEIPEELQDKLEQNAVILDPTSNAIDEYFISITDYEKDSFFYEATLFNYGSIRNEYGDRFSLTKSLK